MLTTLQRFLHAYYDETNPHPRDLDLMMEKPPPTPFARTVCGGNGIPVCPSQTSYTAGWASSDGRFPRICVQGTNVSFRRISYARATNRSYSVYPYQMMA